MPHPHQGADDGRKILFVGSDNGQDGGQPNQGRRDDNHDVDGDHARLQAKEP
jgi:hypothetical protein